MLGLVAFVMLSPQAQEAVFGEFGGVEEFLQSQLAPYHVYPNEASYTLSKIAEVSKGRGEGTSDGEHSDRPRSNPRFRVQPNSPSPTEPIESEPVVLQQTLQIRWRLTAKTSTSPSMACPIATVPTPSSRVAGTRCGGQPSEVETTNARLQNA